MQIEKKRTAPTLERLNRYLIDYRNDRDLAMTTHHQDKVDRIYRQDSRIATWTAHYHAATSTTYAVRAGRFHFTPGTPPATQLRIQLEHDA